MAVVMLNSGALSQKSIIKLPPQIHPKKFSKHNFTKDGNEFKYSYKTQLIGSLKYPKRIVYAWCSNENRIEEEKTGEISPLLPSSCRYVPSCSEYSMQAYKRYGVLKGTVLTAWRLCQCNPLGGSGFDPPRWFDESKPPSS